MYAESLRKYYIKWYKDCLDSAAYCRRNGNFGLADDYTRRAAEYKTIIEQNNITEAESIAKQ